MSNFVDLIIHAGTKLALEQWLQARGLGVSFQDTDPLSPTFGDWFYRHTDNVASRFLYWNHPSGLMPETRTVDDTDPENPIIDVTYFAGFYGILRFHDAADFETRLAPWFRDFTAFSNLGIFQGIGGEGITLVEPDQVESHLDGIGATSCVMQNAGEAVYSNPRFWYLSPVMTGDIREWPEGSGDNYESLIDNNVWTPGEAPLLWDFLAPSTDEWAAGTTYAVDDVVTYEGTEYRCLQAHTAISAWTPPAVPALWTPV